METATFARSQALVSGKNGFLAFVTKLTYYAGIFPGFEYSNDLQTDPIARLQVIRAYFILLIPCSLLACSGATRPASPSDAVEITALVETDPVSAGGDAADDPAIWLHPDDPMQSRIIGTDKNFGIEVYDLDGLKLQSIKAGRTNNIDLRYLPGNEDWSAVAAASNRSTNSISLFLVNHSGELTWLEDSEIVTGLTEPYGLCMFANAVGVQVFVNDTDGRYQQWLLQPDWRSAREKPLIKAALVREFSVSSQPEGCVADDANQRLFVGIENEGIFVLAANHQEPATMQTIALIDDEILVADVEGMSLYLSSTGGYLVASSQGNYSYAVYDRLPPFTYRGSFLVVDNIQARVDGTEETDGLDISSLLIAPQFPEGAVVLQDGFNTLPDGAQNFKYVSWQDIRLALGL